MEKDLLYCAIDVSTGQKTFIAAYRFSGKLSRIENLINRPTR
jgi:hypothetical protein